MKGHARTTLIALFLGTFLAACGGGGGGGYSPPPQPPPDTDWQAGVFLPEEDFALRCEVPGNSFSIWTGLPVPDVQGTTLDENNFLRSWSHRTYLWYDEITDQDPANFNDTLTYFDQLKTFATTASGAPKDKYHYTWDTQEYYQLAQVGVSSGYGVEWAVISPTIPRDIRVAFTEPNTPATDNGVLRGTRVLAVDGVDINVNTQQGVDTLNAGLFPSTNGEVHDFTIEDPDGAVRTITMVSEEIIKSFVQGTQVINTPSGGRVGYMLFTAFRSPAEAQLVSAIETLNAGEGITDLVLDLRYNGGGFGDLACELGYMIAGPTNLAGSYCELVQFNDQHPATDPITGQPLAPTPFFSTAQGFSVPAGQALPTLGLPRVFVLTGPGTASASELLMNGLRGAGVQVIQIGETTSGKPYGFYPQDNCGTLYFTIQLRGVNNLDYGDYTDGFIPSAVDNGEDQVLGCVVGDDFSQQLGDPAEDRLEVALAYIEGQDCIAPAALANDRLGIAVVRDPAIEPHIMRPAVETLRIMRKP